MKLTGLLLLLLLLTGCAHFRPEPALDPPPWPKVKFVLDSESRFCLDQENMQGLGKWLDKLRAFFAARERLQKGPGL